MFHRRRASSNPPRATTPTPSAALAASQAFLNSRQSNASLSSAAAAAALRSHTTSPVPVGDVQTKRMQRRTSNTSLTSDAVTGRAPFGSAVRRQNSSGSMTERTFRSPSPGRNSRVVPAESDAPPVPVLPKDVPPIPKKSYRRASSLEPPVRVTSPEPRTPGGRPVSVDRGMTPSTGRSSAKRPTGLAKVPELERENSQRSINFSRPISPPASPPTSPIRTSKSGWHTSPAATDATPRAGPPTQPKTAGTLPANEVSSIQQSIQDASDKPVTKKKKKVVAGKEGKHLASGSMNKSPETNLGSDAPSNTARGKAADATPKATYPGSPRNPTSPVRVASPTQERTSGGSTKAAALLQKQPSVVHEDEELEEREEYPKENRTVQSIGGKNAAIQHNRPASASVTPAKTYAQGKERVRSASLDVTNGSVRGVDRIDRPQSVSPARAARFSNAPVELLNGIKHQPPPRSVSPAKSALKHSRSSSLRASSPIANVAPVPGKKAASDVSDTVSDDGIKAGPRKKKSVRVSFEEEPATISTSVGPAIPVTAIGGTPRRTTDIIDDEETLKPTPALPSFGSIRGRKPKEQELEMPEKVTETVSSSMSTSVSTLEPSSDHAVGAILAQHHASKAQPRDQPAVASIDKPLAAPVPPEVTSVEGTGYGSDTDTSVSDQVNQPKTLLNYRPDPQTAEESKPATTETEPQSLDNDNSKLPVTAEADVPSIAILPATPAVEEIPEKKGLTIMPYIMPGGFPESSLELDKSASTSKPAPTDKSATTGETAPTDISTKGGGHAAEKPTINITPAADATEAQSDSAPTPVPRPASPSNGASTWTYPEDESESDDNSSVYSDAEEDISGEFASLDAIVKSPIVPSPPVLTVSTPPDSPSVATAPRQSRFSNWLPGQDDATSSPVSTGDWDQTKAYWSGLTQKQKQQLEKEHLPDDEKPDRNITAEVQPEAPKPKKKKKKQTTLVERTEPAAIRAIPPPSSIRQNRQSVQPPPPAMKQSMRGPAPQPQGPETHMRKSMRSGGTMAATMRGPDPAVSRPKSPPLEAKEPRGALQKKHIPPAQPRATAARAAPTAVPSALRASMPPLTRNDSSASESSFRKRRRGVSSISEDGRYSMRRSMRGASQPPPTPSGRPTSPTPAGPAAGKGRRFSIRSLSPSGSLMGGRMRASMRTSIDSTTPTLRSQPAPTLRSDPRTSKSPTRFSGFGKTSRPKSPPAQPTSRFKSRFAADSDDEGDVRPAFRSRFADSDDEDDRAIIPADLTPVRGIPRRPGDGDRESTDLSDEESPEPASPPIPFSKDIDKASAPAHLTNGNPQGKALAAGSLRTNGAGASAKHAADVPNGLPGKKEKPKRGFFGLGKKKVAPAAATTAGDSSSARPTTPTARPATASAAVSSPRSGPRLQRRNSATPTPSDSWPLPAAPTGVRAGAGAGAGAGMGNVRPSTADGAPGMHHKTMRPELRHRRSVGFDERGKEVVLGRSGKKKKFQGLRRVFGLVD